MKRQHVNRNQVQLPPFDVKTGDEHWAILLERRVRIRIEKFWVNPDGEGFVEFSFRPNWLARRETLVWEMQDFREICLVEFQG